MQVTRDGRIVQAIINNPPINIITLALYAELVQLSKELEADDEALVLVLKSANPDFFIAHFDVAAILSFPVDNPPTQESNEYHDMCERFRTMNKVTIAQIEGRVGGGGSELIASFDMRFGVRGKTVINQMEVAVGILPGGTGTQRWPRLVGRGRALEAILGSIDIDAETAERWGYLNRALAADEIGRYVDWLARRIAGFPAPAIRLAKESVDASAGPLAEGLREEAFLFQRLIREPSARSAMARFLEIGGQTREGELNVEELCARLSST
ncbi:MAG: enoyl-CoA hydratase/isomerase family protein [Alphaproteobacteria bacterium]|nr:enoyl-CoA hydratase/isomerase family protein [Alphaproteobacteria bacterium]